MPLRKKLLYVLLMFVVLSCTSDSESDLYSNEPLNNVTYSNSIKSIITNNCIMCHSQPPQNGAPMPLISYDFVKAAVISRGLLDRISSNDPGFWMPYGGERLPQDQINKIISWSNNNFPE